jgi:hypothetical protein
MVCPLEESPCRVKRARPEKDLLDVRPGAAAGRRGTAFSHFGGSWPNLKEIV